MNSKPGLTHRCIDFLLLLLLFTLVGFSLLPIKFLYKELLAILLLVSSVALFIYSFRIFFSKFSLASGSSIVYLGGALILWVIIQIVPLPIEVFEQLSEHRLYFWNQSAYGLDGYITISLDITGTMWTLMFMFVCLAVCFLSFKVCSNKTSIVLLLTFVFTLGLYQIAFDIVTKSLGFYYISPSEIDGHWYRTTGTFTNANNLSALLNLSVAAGLTLFSYSAFSYTRSHSIVYLLIGFIILTGLAVLLYGSIRAGSAGGFLALFLAFFVVILAFVITKLNFKLLLYFLLVCLVGVMLLTLFGGRELNIEHLLTKQSLGGRQQMWLDILAMWRHFPLAGIGAGAFEQGFIPFKTARTSSLWVANAHSSYLQILAEVGLVGVAIIICIAFAYVKNLFKLIKRQHESIYFIAPLMVGFLAFMVHGVIDNNFFVLGVSIPFFCLLGMTLNLNNLFDNGERL